MLGDGRIGIFGFDLRIEARRFGGIVFRAVVLGESEHDHRLGNQHGRLGDQILVEFDGFVALSGAVVHLGQFKTSHGGQIVVAAIGEALQPFFGFVILVEFFVAEAGVISGELAGAGARELFGYIGKFLSGQGVLGLFVVVGGFAGLRGFAGGGDARTEDFHSVIVGGGCFDGLVFGVGLEAENGKSDGQRHGENIDGELLVGEDRAGALRQGFANFVRLQVFAGKMVRQRCTSKGIRTRNNSIKTGVGGLCVAG